MRTNVQIIPAILATTEEEYEQKLKKIEACPELAEGWVQVDFMDNKFVQNKSISPQIMAKYPSELKIEAHLMVDYPEDWIDELIKMGVKRIVFPVEDDAGISERIGHIRNHGVEVGLALNPETPVGKVEPFIGKIDVVLVMSVHPGFEGKEFLPEALDKVRKLAELKNKGDFLVEVDGGINETVVKELTLAGTDSLILGEHLINGDIAENLEKIWESLGA